jgi:hypothetical protein
MARTPSPRSLDQRLRQLTREYDALKVRIQNIGFICTGSLVERWTTCGKPNCSCSTDPEQRHGPYYQLTWKEAGLTDTTLIRAPRQALQAVDLEPSATRSRARPNAPRLARRRASAAARRKSHVHRRRTASAHSLAEVTMNENPGISAYSG